MFYLNLIFGTDFPSVEYVDNHFFHWQAGLAKLLGLAGETNVQVSFLFLILETEQSDFTVCQKERNDTYFAGPKSFSFV